MDVAVPDAIVSPIHFPTISSVVAVMPRAVKTLSITGSLACISFSGFVDQALPSNPIFGSAISMTFGHGRKRKLTDFNGSTKKQKQNKQKT
jgi:hypothetical protein